LTEDTVFSHIPIPVDDDREKLPQDCTIDFKINKWYALKD